jgi:hypothetical protein
LADSLAIVQSHAVQGRGEVEVKMACTDLEAPVVGGGSPATVVGGVARRRCGWVG